MFLICAMCRVCSCLFIVLFCLWWFVIFGLWVDFVSMLGVLCLDLCFVVLDFGAFICGLHSLIFKCCVLDVGIIGVCFVLFVFVFCNLLFFCVGWKFVLCSCIVHFVFISLSLSSMSSSLSLLWLLFSL